MIYPRLNYLALLLAAVGLAGCIRHAPTALKDPAGEPMNWKRSKGEAPRSRGVFVRAEPQTDAETERRIEAHARFAAGISHELQDQPQQALEEFFLGALADASNEMLVTDVTRRLLREKQFEKALQLLNKAVATPNASGAIFALQGYTLAQLGRTDQAIEANRKAIAKSPDLLQAYQNLAQLHFENKKPAEALKVLDEAAEQVALDAVALVDLAETYGQHRKQHSAQSEALTAGHIRTLDQAAALKPTNPGLLLRMAENYQLAGQPKQAAEIYLELLARSPGLPGIRERLADIYIRSGELTLASEQLESIVRDNPTNPQAYIFLAGIAHEQKDYERALEHLQKAMLLGPDIEQVYYDMAGLHLNLDQPESTLAILERAREKKFPQRFVPEFYAGMAHSRLKQYDQALQHFTAAEVIAGATDRDRLNHGFYFQLGATHERKADYEQAENYFKRALQMAPDFHEALNYLGYMWAERGVNLEEARVMIEKALTIEPDNAAYLDSMAWVLFKLGQPQEALGYMLKAIRFSEEPDPTIFDHLGDIYAALERLSDARKAWQKALDLEPSEEIEKKLKQSATPAKP